MKKMRIPLLIAWVIAVAGIVCGSFFDLQISTAIASPRSTLGLVISAIGPTIGFAGVAVLGGGFLAFIKHGKYHIILKILFAILALACLGVAVYYPAGEYFGINGFYGVLPEWVGYPIAAVPAIGATIGGYFLFKDYQNKNLWVVFVIIIVLLCVALLAVIPTLKDTMHRPRYRLISTNENVKFHNWWEPCKNYKELIETYNIHKDNFKSYPSGHTAEASILLVTITFLPLANKKFEKVQLPLFIVAFLIVLGVAFARILAAAHYLSDVSTGATVILTLLFIANEIVAAIKPLQLKEEVAETVNEESAKEPVQEQEEVEEVPAQEEQVEEQPEPEEPVEAEEQPKEEVVEEKPIEKKAAPKKAPNKKAEEKKPATKKPAEKKPADKKEEPKEPKKNASYHISKRASDNKWQVFRAGSEKVIKLFDTKVEAEEYTKRMAENQGVSYLSHASKGKNKGKIQKK